MIQIERASDLILGDARTNVGVGEQVVAKRALPAERLHRVSLDENVRLLAGHSRFDEREEDRLAEEEPPSPREIFRERLRVHDEPVDERARAILHEGEGRRRVGRDHPLDARVRDVALVPERDILERGHDVASEHPREPGEVLAEDRVALVRHRRRALLPFGEKLLCLADLVSLPMANVRREPLDARADHRERRKERRVPIARDDLGRNGLSAEAER